MRPVHEAVSDDVVHLPWLPQVLQQPSLAVGDPINVPVQASEKRLAIVEQADVVSGEVVRRLDIAHPLQRVFEFSEIRPGVPVVRPEAGQVDVAKEQYAVGLDHEGAVTPGMAGRVNHPHRDAAAEIEQVAVPERHGVRPGLVEERRPQVPSVLLATFRFDPEDVEEAVEVEQAGQILLVNVDRGVPEQRQRRGVILMAVAQQHEVDTGQTAPTPRPNAERWIDQRRRLGPLHHQGVVVGVLAAAFAEQDRRGAEPAIFEPGHLAWLGSESARRRFGGRHLRKLPSVVVLGT